MLRSAPAHRFAPQVSGIAILIGALVSVAWVMSPSSREEGANVGGRWSWTTGALPGRPGLGEPSETGRRAAQAAFAITHADVDRASVRTVVSADAFANSLTLLAAAGADNEPCFTFATGYAGTREFSCLSRSSDNAIFRFVADGGTKPGVVAWVSMVGLVRSDVTRLTLVVQSGDEEPLKLNVWRAFAYSADAQPAFPVALRAYGADGNLIEQLPTHP